MNISGFYITFRDAEGLPPVVCSYRQGDESGNATGPLVLFEPSSEMLAAIAAQREELQGE